MMGRGFGGGGPGGFPGDGRGFGGPGMPGGPGFGRGGGYLPFHGLPMLFVMLAVLVALGVAGWYLFRKAGYEGALGLLLGVPLVNVGVLLFLAFAEWPALRELRYRRVAMGDEPAPPPWQALHPQPVQDAVVYPGVTAPAAAPQQVAPVAEASDASPTVPLDTRDDPDA